MSAIQVSLMKILVQNTSLVMVRTGNFSWNFVSIQFYTNHHLLGMTLLPWTEIINCHWIVDLFVMHQSYFSLKCWLPCGAFHGSIWSYYRKVATEWRCAVKEEGNFISYYVRSCSQLLKSCLLFAIVQYFCSDTFTA